MNAHNEIVINDLNVRTRLRQLDPSIVKIFWQAKLGLVDSLLQLYPNVRELIYSGGQLGSLRGIQHLAQLEVLVCSNNEGLKSLDGVQNLKKLRVIDCSNCPISSLKAISGLNLEELYCCHRPGYNMYYSRLKGLSSLDGIQTSFNLRVLDCQGNNITSLVPLKGCRALEELNCSQCKLTSIDIISCFPFLTKLDCSRNFLRTICSIRNCPNLIELRCRFSGLNSLKGTEACTKLEVLDCSYNKLRTLKEIAVCINLRVMDAQNNQLRILGDLSQLQNLTHLECQSNQLSSLDGIGNCINLTHLKIHFNDIASLTSLRLLNQLVHLKCDGNRLATLDGIQMCAHLTCLECFGNGLETLDGIQTCTQLTHLDCRSNRLASIEPVTMLTNLIRLGCENNQITSMEPVVYLRRLTNCTYHGNPIEVQSIRFERFIEQHRYGRLAEVTVYGNSQNVHDIAICKSVCKSLVALLSDPKPTFTTPELLSYVQASDMSDRAKKLVTAYCADKCIHSVHRIRYEELLSYVWNRIIHSEHTSELVKILSQQICDSDGKCFTGRFNRTLSALVGFSPDIVIEISDSSRIGAIILAVRSRVIPYDAVIHQAQVLLALIEAGYDEETVQPWLDAIDE